MHRKTLHTLILLLGCLALAGCWESTDVTFHQPGEYYGPSDDLSADSAALQERLDGQRDR